VAGPVGAASIQSAGGNLVYSINVSGDDSDTPAKDGGVAGDLITFSIGGRAVATATWASGANLNTNIHPPQPAVANSGPVDEGGSATVSAAGSQDWGGDIVSYAFDCDNNGSYEVGPQPGPSTSCAFGDGPGSYPVGVRLLDAQGGVGVATTTVVVNNLAPSATFSAPASANEGGPISLALGAPADVPADLPGLSYAFDCGDGGGYGAFGPASSASSSCARVYNLTA
jgi:hypothetical protein